MAVTNNDIRVSIETEFQTQWGATTPVAWDNADLEDLPDGPWARLTIVPFQSRNVTIGTNESRKSGAVAVQVFTKLNIGSGTAYALADQVVAILENKVLGKVFTYASTIERVGDGVRRVDQIEQDWFQLNVTTRYEAQ